MNSRFASLSDDGLRASGQSISLLIDASSASAGQAEIVLLHHAEDDQVCSISLRTLDRFSRGIARRGRQVDCQQDPLSARLSGFAHVHRVWVSPPHAMCHPARIARARQPRGGRERPHLLLPCLG